MQTIDSGLKTIHNIGHHLANIKACVTERHSIGVDFTEIKQLIGKIK